MNKSKTNHFLLMTGSLLFLLSSLPAQNSAGWWMEEPIRMIQTNLRETDTDLEPERLARQLEAFHANTLLFGMGGIVAHYPTDLDFHFRSPSLPERRDTFGEMLKEAHARGIRVIGRFDFSKTQKPVYDAHPEWFFLRMDGKPVVYNGLYSACINGGYYRNYIFKILTEALTRYEVDGLFFNMFGNPRFDYSGEPMGPCHCSSCSELFRVRYRKDLPADDSDPEYREFMDQSSREVAATIGELIERLRPGAAFLTYIQEHVSGIMSESNTSVNRPLPLWLYSSSDNVNFARTSEPGKMSFNLSMSFVDYAWRFAAVPFNEIQIRLRQALAHGGALAQNMHGTMDQEDRSFLEAARSVFSWAAANENLYVGQVNQGRVLLLGPRNHSYRGFFRLLSERHIPFLCSSNLRVLEERPDQVDLIVCTAATPSELERYLQNGGRVLVAGTRHPGLGLPKMIRRWENIRGYFRVRDHSLFPSLELTNLMFVYGDYLELPSAKRELLTLIPPSMFGPPEKVFTDKIETDKPGVVIRELGRGVLIFVPWDIGGLYYRYGSEAHAGLMTDLIDYLLPGTRQLITNAHPLVEITLMGQAKKGRTLVHLVNLSGHSDVSYFPAIPIQDVEISVQGEFRSARSARLDQSLNVERDGRAVRFTLPFLESYDVVVLE